LNFSDELSLYRAGGQQIKTICSINGWALLHKQQRQLALWYLMRYLDDPEGTGVGRGWVPVTDLIAKAVEVGWWNCEKAVRNVIELGTGTWWYRDVMSRPILYQS